jgi:uncharacterized protein (TIGR00299 family) protein
VKIAYFDCFSGISGDMCLGALVDAGVSLKEIEKSLKGIPVKGYSLVAKKVRRSGIAATKVEVVLKGNSGQHTGKWNDISKIIRASKLPEGIRNKGHEIFKSLFEAEAQVHGESLAKVHLHELSSADCIVDIFGTLIGLSLLKVEAVYCSPVNLGGGSVKTAHGILPVPAPATAVILKNTLVYSSDAPHELTTPTGAVILKSLSKGFGPMPCFKYEKTGVGAGSRDIKNRPNVLRVFIGEMNSEPCDEAEAVTVIETNIDDMNPQIYEYVIDELFKRGALDVFLTQIIMKKTRPAVKLTVLCDRDKREDLINTILKETTSIGVRYFETQRVTMDREIREFPSKYGKVRVKSSVCGRHMVKSSPEFEDCKKIARETSRPLREIIDEVGRLAGKKRK